MGTDKGYYSGNLRADALNGKTRNWVLGNSEFMKDPLRQTEQIEVKYWEFNMGEEKKHGAKTSDTIEWTYILKGGTRALIGRNEVILSQGDYVLIHPGTPNNIVLASVSQFEGND